MILTFKGSIKAIHLVSDSDYFPTYSVEELLVALRNLLKPKAPLVHRHRQCDLQKARSILAVQQTVVRKIEGDVLIPHD